MSDIVEVMYRVVNEVFGERCNGEIGAVASATPTIPFGAVDRTKSIGQRQTGLD